jgi:hypothetical protein
MQVKGMAPPQWAAAAAPAPALCPNGTVTLEDDDENLCSICLDQPRHTIFMPCGHHVTCRSCAADIRAKTNECPICRTGIADMFDAVF